MYYREFDFDFIRGMMQEMKDEYKVEYTEEPDKSLKYPRQRIYTELHADMTKVSKMLKLSNEKHYERVKKHLDACNRQGVPIATQVFTINEKWVLVKFLKRYFSFCV